MKITKKQLIQIIKEELEDLAGQEEEPEVADSDVKSGMRDVAMVKDKMVKIDTPVEYKEIVELVLSWGDDIPRKQQVLRALYRQLPELIKKV